MEYCISQIYATSLWVFIGAVCVNCNMFAILFTGDFYIKAMDDIGVVMTQFGGVVTVILVVNNIYKRVTMLNDNPMLFKMENE